MVIRTIALLFAAAALVLFPFGSYPRASAAMTTTDKFISLQNDGILEGRAGGDPALEAGLTRAEMATILFRVYQLSPVTSSSSFADTAGHWAQKAGYIEAVIQKQLMEGVGGGLFEPDSPMTTEQLATILLRMAHIDPSSYAAAPQGTTSPWARDIVATALNKRIIAAADDYTQPASRGETVDDLYPLYEQIKAAAAPAVVPYSLELSRWGISNDGTHPVETTDGFNKALQWAHEQGYNVFQVPAGTYLISKGTGQYDVNARINMVSNMTFQLDDNAVMQKETNGYQGYVLLYIGPSISDVVVKGGTYQGDKDTHDYSSGGTHESGYGILAEGANHLVIDGVKTINFTGDGICVGGKFDVISSLYENDFESGGIDDKGQLVASAQTIRISNLTKTQLDLQNHPERRTVVLERPTGITNSNMYDIYFYKADGTFVSSAKQQEFYWSYVAIPAGAAYFNAVFQGSSVVGSNRSVVGQDGIHGMGVYAKSKSDNVTIRNSESAFNRRQGITIGGGNNIVVTGTTLHDIQGTAPQSGIDVEGGVYPNTHITITQNNFYNNKGYGLILYDGRDAFVGYNRFGQASIGLAVSNPFTGATIYSNSFDASGITAFHDVAFVNNKMNNGNVNLVGKNMTVDGFDLTDSSFTINSSVPQGIAVANTTLTNTGVTNVGLNIFGKPTHLTNIVIQGPATRVLGGSVDSGSIFDNVKILDYDASLSLDLPPGIYNNCVIRQQEGGRVGATINDASDYVFNGCTFSVSHSALVIDNKDATVTVSNSKFGVQSVTGYGAAVIDVQSAKAVAVTNNTFDEKINTLASFGSVHIGKAGASAATQPVKAAVSGNTIQASSAVPGISTVDAGSGPDPYQIENNVLYNAKLQLRTNDISTGNQELAQ